MSKHGTASDNAVQGWYVGFQAAVLHALPRNVDVELAEYFTAKGGAVLASILAETLLYPVAACEAVGTFLVSVEAGVTTEQLIAAGNYSEAPSWMVSKVFPVRKRLLETVCIKLLKFQYPPTTAQVVGTAGKLGLLRADYEFALFFGAQYPEEQRNGEIIFPEVNKDRDAIRLSGDSKGRYLYRVWGSGRWGWNGLDKRPPRFAFVAP